MHPPNLQEVIVLRVQLVSNLVPWLFSLLCSLEHEKRIVETQTAQLEHKVRSPVT